MSFLVTLLCIVFGIPIALVLLFCLAVGIGFVWSDFSKEFLNR